jgi:three-Cys-motif partner protein
MPDMLWKLEPATKAKHRLYERYLGAWWAKLLQSSFPRVTYVDAFAGPGRYLDGEPGSPIMVLDQLLHHEARDRCASAANESACCSARATHADTTTSKTS